MYTDWLTSWLVDWQTLLVGLTCSMSTDYSGDTTHLLDLWRSRDCPSPRLLLKSTCLLEVKKESLLWVCFGERPLILFCILPPKVNTNTVRVAISLGWQLTQHVCLFHHLSHCLAWMSTVSVVTEKDRVIQSSCDEVRIRSEEGKEQRNLDSKISNVTYCPSTRREIAKLLRCPISTITHSSKFLLVDA